MPEKLPSHYVDGDVPETGTTLTPRDLLASADDPAPAPKTLSRPQVARDLALLRYAFETGYGGRKHIDASAFQTALDRIDDLASTLEQPTPRALCNALGEVLAELPDNHLRAKVDGIRCHAGRHPVGTVGNNIGAGRSKPWLVEARRQSGQRFALVSITSLPHHDDPIWKGFHETVDEVLDDAPALVLDMRGNGGGDDTTGRRLATRLWGGPSPAKATVIKSTTPSTFALAANGVQLRIRELRRNGDPIPAFYDERLARFLGDLDAALSGPHADERTVPPDRGVPYDSTKGYDRPIYVLVDRACGSSCESTLEWLEGHPELETVGENTAGFVHFGNMGYAELPHSRIVVQLATDFWRFDDGRWVEKIGYAPTIPVPSGQDALDVALTRLAAK